MESEVQYALNLLKRNTYKIFFVVFIVSGLVAIFALRSNNQQMIVLRNKVYQADKDAGDVNLALNNLRAYVYAHMNTDLSSGGNTIKPPIQLKYTYERLEAQAQQSANNTNLYTAAENYCQAKIPASVSVSGRGRISCITDYVTSHGGKQPAAIPAGLYEFDFISPSWSPDRAGWSLLIAALSAVGFLVSLFIQRLRHI